MVVNCINCLCLMERIDCLGCYCCLRKDLEWVIMLEELTKNPLASIGKEEILCNPSLNRIRMSLFVM